MTAETRARRDGMTNFERVGEFHRAFGHDFGLPLRRPSRKRMELRIRLIREELRELQGAYATGDLVAMADAYADLLYVVYGGGYEMGIDLDACFAEVHRSNMTKLGADGKPVKREDGKILKGPNYERPNLAPLITGDDQGIAAPR